MRILVADDDPVFVELARAILQAQGWEVVAAMDAMQVMMMAMRSPPPGAILLDVDMPGGTGLTALQRLKQSTKTMAIPVVVVTGSTDPELPARVRGLGARGFARKPVDPATFGARLKAMLEPGPRPGAG